MELLVSNVSGKARRATLHGRDHVVVPMTLLVPGVLAGSQGPLYYPADEVQRDPAIWNGIPILLDHPDSSSGRTPEVVEAQGVGTVFNVEFRDGKLVAEGWIDVARAQQIGNGLLAAIETSKKLELSTGLFTDEEAASEGAAFNGREYRAIARNYRPDHLALLPDSIGACSIADGCGVFNEHDVQENVMDDKEREAIVNALIADPCCWEEKDRDELMKLTENQLTSLKAVHDRANEMEAVANKAQAEFTDTAGNVHKWDEKDQKWASTMKPVVNEEKPALTAEQLEDLDFARQVKQERRDEAIGKITANEQNKLSDEQLAAMPLATLQAIAASLPAKPVANYSGAAGTAQATHNEEKFAPFGLPSEYIPVEN